MHAEERPQPAISFYKFLDTNRMKFHSNGVWTD